MKNLCKYYIIEFFCVSREANSESDWPHQRECEYYLQHGNHLCHHFGSIYRCQSELAQEEATVLAKLEDL